MFYSTSHENEHCLAPCRDKPGDLYCDRRPPSFIAQRDVVQHKQGGKLWVGLGGGVKVKGKARNSRNDYNSRCLFRAVHPLQSAELHEQGSGPGLSFPPPSFPSP